jgi:hypothetical protein
LFDNVVIFRPAQEFFDSLDDDDKAEVRRLLRIIIRNPFWDNRTKFLLPIYALDSVFADTLYHSERFEIVYHVVGDDTIWVLGIAHTQ